VITTGEARLIMKDKSAMKTALLCLQIEAGDRRDDPYTNHAIADVLSISATSSSHHRARILDESARVESAPRPPHGLVHHDQPPQALATPGTR
jgi:hypothetical protein